MNDNFHLNFFVTTQVDRLKAEGCGEFNELIVILAII